MNSINVLIEMTFSGQLFGRSWTFLWHFPFMDSINVPGQIDFSCKLATTFWTHVCLNSIINNRIVFFFSNHFWNQKQYHILNSCAVFFLHEQLWNGVSNPFSDKIFFTNWTFISRLPFMVEITKSNLKTIVSMYLRSSRTQV